ncbi:MAG: 50S ribosomal protein L30 [Deltaproteobacteria bacterium]|nr:50S ribosomal protein L30 [Deltaproteobacteria bacterium]
MATTKTQKKITIRLIKGLAGCTDEQRATVRGLGLRHRMHESTLENSSSVRGMIKKVIHMVDIVSEK